MLLSCDSEETDTKSTKEKGIYKVMLEATGEHYIAKIHIYNTDNVNLTSDGYDIGEASFTTIFKGTKEFSTAKEVKNIAVQCEISSRTPATLKMIIYKDDKCVYDKRLPIIINDIADSYR